LSPSGYVKIRPTLQLESYPSIFAIGDIIDYPEGKRAIKGNGHIAVVIRNVISYLKDPSRPLKKEYRGSLEAAVFTNGRVSVFFLVL
jgi:NADH dehydrogenase FAD-containing subunit